MTESQYLPLIDQIAHAADNRARAQLLLKLPDFVFCTYGSQLAQVLADCNFAGGAKFASEREMAMHTPRDADGMLRADMAGELERWRVTLVRFAAGEDLGAKT